MGREVREPNNLCGLGGVGRSRHHGVIAAESQKEATMRADQVELSWDSGKSKWLVRIVNGEEVIRRYFNLPKDADEKALGTAAQKTVQDEGYEADPAVVSVRR
jgi:hypothetical protein